MTVMIDTSRMLFEAARERLSDQELGSLVDLGEHGADDARRMALFCDGLSCLIESDSLQQGGRAGSFQSGATIGNLLAVLGSAFDSIGARADVADAARAELAARTKGRAAE